MHATFEPTLAPARLAAAAAAGVVQWREMRVEEGRGRLVGVMRFSARGADGSSVSCAWESRYGMGKQPGQPGMGVRGS